MKIDSYQKTRERERERERELWRILHSENEKRDDKSL